MVHQYASQKIAQLSKEYEIGCLQHSLLGSHISILQPISILKVLKSSAIKQPMCM